MLLFSLLLCHILFCESYVQYTAFLCKSVSFGLNNIRGKICNLRSAILSLVKIHRSPVHFLNINYLFQANTKQKCTILHNFRAQQKVAHVLHLHTFTAKWLSNLNGLSISANPANQKFRTNITTCLAMCNRYPIKKKQISKSENYKKCKFFISYYVPTTWHFSNFIFKLSNWYSCFISMLWSAVSRVCIIILNFHL